MDFRFKGSRPFAALSATATAEDGLVWAYDPLVGFVRIVHPVPWCDRDREGQLAELGFHEAARWGEYGSSLDCTVWTDGSRYLLLLSDRSDAVTEVWCEDWPSYLGLLGQLLPVVREALEVDQLTEDLQ